MVALGLFVALLSLLSPAEGRADQGGRLARLAGSSAGRMPSGWELCDQTDDLFQLEVFNVSPDPPRRGQFMSIHVKGHLLEALEDGTVEYTVRYGGIPIVHDKQPLCEALALEPSLPQCPLRAGKWNIKRQIDLPYAVPFGKYSISAVGWNPQGERIFCVEGTTVLSLRAEEAAGAEYQADGAQTYWRDAGLQRLLGAAGEPQEAWNSQYPL